MLARDTCRTFLLIVCACAVALAQNKGPPDKINDFCWIRGSALSNYNEKVYIYGGFASWKPGFEAYSGPNNDLRTIDVSKPFNIASDVDTFVKRTPLTGTVPRDTFGTLWPIAQDTLASFFGWHEISHDAVDHNISAITKAYPLISKFTLDTTTNLWSAGQVKSTANFELPNQQDPPFLKIGSQMSAWIPSLQRGYYFGGYVFKDAADLTWDTFRGAGYHNGMLIYDAKLDTLTNVTIPSQNTDGQLVHLTTKDDEILINFGGSNPGQRNMTDFLIYSTKHSTWFNFHSSQTDPLPPPRSWFCTAVVSAPDNSSHQIFMYGGGTDDNAMASTDTVWVLSIPSFDWIQLPGGSQNTSIKLPRERREPTCLRVGKKYMMSWGGAPKSGCEEDGAHNVFLLDMTSGSWVNEFNPDDDYEVPQKVVDVIGGTKKGGATKLEPDGSFRDPQLARLMTFNTGPNNGQTSDALLSGNHSTSNKATTGAIVGGVVGGIAGLAIIGGAVFYMLRAKRNDNPSENSPGPVEAPAEPVKKPGISPTQVMYPRGYDPVSPPVELYPGDIRLGELDGVSSLNELPADRPVVK
ncbi:hypothetical protein BZA77DRAFT_28968 [Pyronema omphalodes]|nr:hypothetical protein BZA77DRAFT_28968 [Pyronema omphalodes]